MNNLSIAVLSGIIGLLVSQWSNGLVITSLVGDMLVNILLPMVFIFVTYISLAK
jgi:hypothetical protein